MFLKRLQSTKDSQSFIGKTKCKYFETEEIKMNIAYSIQNLNLMKANIGYFDAVMLELALEWQQSIAY